MLLAAFAALFVPATILAFSTGGSPPAPASKPDGAPSIQAALSAYSDAIAPAVADAGGAIVVGIRPDITDFRSGHITAEVWKTDMQARARQFADDEGVFVRTASPAGLEQTRAVFLDAFAGYRLAAVALHAAGDADGAAREQLIGLGASLGDLADHTFDRAAVALQAARRRAGLPADTRLTTRSAAPPATTTATPAVTLARPCAHPGDTQTLTVHAAPGAAVVFDTVYADRSDDLVAGYGSGAGHGAAGTSSTFHVSWVVPQNAPAGPATVHVGAADGVDAVRATAIFAIAPPGRACG